jgi:ankyrin repeat protein
MQIPLMELLIEHGAVIDGPDSGSGVNGCLSNGRAQAAEFLANRGGRLNLEAAAGIGRLDAVKSFFNDDGSLTPDTTAKQLKDGFAAACGFGRTRVAEVLMQRGVEVNGKLSDGGETGLHRASMGGHVDTVKLLLERGALVDARDDRYHGTPLDWALYKWSHLTGEADRRLFYEVIALLARAGASLDPRQWYDSEQGRSPMVEAIDSDPRMLAVLRGEAAPPD